MHWFTDLSGAIPTPLCGAEKFVIKFPKPVLSSFIKSFSIVQRIATHSATKVYEDFLVEWWPTSLLGAAPTGPESIALMRLIVQAQLPSEQERVYDAIFKVDEDVRRSLVFELSLTGIAGEKFERMRSRTSDAAAGPAFLVYYSPAWIRSAVQANPRAALNMLAEVYARARDLFPLRNDWNGQNVVVYIDQLKGCETDQVVQESITNGRFWLLVKKNDFEAAVEQKSMEAMPFLFNQPGIEKRARLLRFWRGALDPKP